MGVDERLRDGIDVSSYSGTVDWSQVLAQGKGFAFLKATEGMTLKDSAFATNWPLVKQAGMLRGAYHFYVTEDDPEAQASFFIDNVSLEPGDLAPVVDVEVLGKGTQPGLPGQLKTFVDLIAGHYGIKPVVYTTASFWDANLDDSFGAYPLWVAEYGVQAPRLPSGWQDWVLWQWQGDATVPGVESTADLDRANTDGVDLSVLILPG